ncbi:MAG: glycosyltransferase family 2 protein [Endomicrobiaceae bacterium]|nr:glycosyltransferase family 2 protein [Endomicrobiaceae bacterium]
MTKELVSIIIPCFNAVEYTKQCIESVLLQTNVNYELILINNGSADGTKKYFDTLKKQLKPNKNLQKTTIIQSIENLGVAKALNLGISKSTGKYICYLNNDVIVTKDWLKKMVKAAKSDKQIGAVGTMFNAFEDKKIVKLAEKDNKIIDVLAQTISIKNSGKIKKARTIHGLCMFIKKTVFKKTGLFNENIYPCFGEDIEFCEILKKNGYKLVDAADVFIFHYWNKSVRSKQFNKQNKNIETVMKSHYKKFSISKNCKI